MNYEIFAKTDLERPIATQDCADDFGAESWARELARQQDEIGDFAITRADGGYAASLFRTVAGQWYVMRR